MRATFVVSVRYPSIGRTKRVITVGCATRAAARDVGMKICLSSTGFNCDNTLKICCESNQLECAMVPLPYSK